MTPKVPMTSSGVQLLADELRPIVEPNDFRTAELAGDPLQRFDDIAAFVALPDVDSR
jgi:hypothetical protein